MTTRHCPFGRQQTPALQGVVGQGVPAPRKRLGVGQAEGRASTQAPVAGLQHAPGHGLGWQTPPGMKTLGAAQLAWATMVQVVSLQHAPVHGLGWQEPPAGPHVPWHCDCTVIVHAPVLEQHGPTGGQGEKKHSPLIGNHPVGQAEPVNMLHAPVLALQQVVMETGQSTVAHVWPGLGFEPVGQVCPMVICVQAPVCVLQQAVTHGLGVHEAFAAQDPLQLAWVVCVHSTLPGMQQRPTGGQGLGLHVTAEPTTPVSGDGHWVPEITEHAPVVGLQQTTCGGTHGGGGQGTPIPRNCPLQALGEATSPHWPVAGLQHAPPVATHTCPGTPHEPPGVNTPSGGRHWVAVVTEQLPVARSQQEPVCTQLICVHVWPRKNCSGGRHWPCPVTIWHCPVAGLQQAPELGKQVKGPQTEPGIDVPPDRAHSAGETLWHEPQQQHAGAGCGQAATGQVEFGMIEPPVFVHDVAVVMVHESVA